MQETFHHPLGPAELAAMALDLRWTWSHEADQFWSALSPEVWERTKNPWLILQVVSQDELHRLLKDRVVTGEVQYLLESRKQYLENPGWFRQNYPEKTLNPIAYFSMEFGLGEALPLYAGGLGILAGDYLKTASDLRVPMVGIGILYREGYFRQLLDRNGGQIEVYANNDPAILPICPVKDTGGGWLHVPLELPGRTLLLRVWQAQVGSVRLYLLDSNDPMNYPADRGITKRLYDDRPEIRLVQEMILGIGGWRLLSTLRIPVEVCHLNEGHAAFVVLERARSFMQQTKESFAVARCATRAGNVFTTHTSVGAGFDTFSPDLMAHYFANFLHSVNIPLGQLLALGRREPDNNSEPFNMAYLAMHGSMCINGVSRLHGKVSRRIFQRLYPRWPEEEVPVGYLTNGVHVPSWDSPSADDLWTRAYGKERWLHNLEDLPEAIRAVTDESLWEFRKQQCEDLVKYVRQKLAYQLGQHGASAEQIREAGLALDPGVLTIGFARRFTAYKRPNLILTDPDRLETIILNPQYPIQLVVAGKAHPDDTEGKNLIRQFIRFAQRPTVRQRVVFLEDYDMDVAQQMVQGVDIWLNTPRRPWEACGTSGMKVLVNGGLNVSELDGWWSEAYVPEVGWALGDGRDHSEAGWDAVEAKQLYELLEKEIAPEFYQRDARGIPVSWVARIRSSLSQLAPHFSSNRMLRGYVENVYLAATGRFRERVRDGARLAKDICDWQSALDKYWYGASFGEVKVIERDNLWRFQIPVYLGRLDPESVRVELYADAGEGHGPVCVPAERIERIEGSVDGYIYQGEVEATRPAEYYTARIIPVHRAASVPLEDSHVLWQR